MSGVLIELSTFPYVRKSYPHFLRDDVQNDENTDFSMFFVCEYTI